MYGTIKISKDLGWGFRLAQNNDITVITAFKGVRVYHFSNGDSLTIRETE